MPTRGPTLTLSALIRRAPGPLLIYSSLGLAEACVTGKVLWPQIRLALGNAGPVGTMDQHLTEQCSRNELRRSTVEACAQTVEDRHDRLARGARTDHHAGKFVLKNTS